MGYYIGKVPSGLPLDALGKARALAQIPGARQIGQPIVWQPNLVCVIDNGNFEAAGYIYNQAELEEFARRDSGEPQRRRTWLIVPGAKDLAGYKE